MKKLFLLSFFILMNSWPVFAVDYEAQKLRAQEKAQKAIDACWAISQEDRDSTSTERQRYGALDTALCMEDHIVELSQKYLYPKHPEYVEETKKNLEEIRSGYGRLTWNLYNSLDACFYTEGYGHSPGCGTVFHSFHNSSYAQILEGLIVRVYNQITSYDLDKEN